jgi:phospholipid-binding lipoprotein MlaA
LAALLALTGIGFVPLLSLEPAHPAAAAEADEAVDVSDEDPFADEEEEEAPVPPIADPLKPVNRAFFHFNDKLYFWALRPVAHGYRAVVPEVARVSIRNLFSNLGAPSRAVNCLLQADLKGSGTELARFAINSTVGVVGLADPAKKRFKIRQRDEDFGQTLGVYGLGPGLYINWPVIGPSSARDTVGFVVNSAMDPATYAPGAGLFARVNNTSLTLGEYEDLKMSALDPYIAMRDAYNQYRRHAVKIRK